MIVQHFVVRNFIFSTTFYVLLYLFVVCKLNYLLQYIIALRKLLQYVIAVCNLLQYVIAVNNLSLYGIVAV